MALSARPSVGTTVPYYHHYINATEDATTLGHTIILHVTQRLSQCVDNYFLYHYRYAGNLLENLLCLLHKSVWLSY